MTNESDIYVEMQQKSFFNRSIILSSNLIDLSHYKVTRKNHEILIFSGKEEVARTDGFSYLNIADVKYKNIDSIHLEKLLSSDDSIDVDWSEYGNTEVFNTRCIVSTSEGKFTISNFIGEGFQYKTRIVIRPFANYVLNDLIACGALLWMFFENQRNQTA